MQENKQIIFMPDQKLMALSWKQPYAELMLHGKIETRTWSTKYRGWVLICASKAAYSAADVRAISGGGDQMYRMGHFLSKEIGKYEGNAIAIGRLVDCREMLREDADACFVKFSPVLFCHVYADVRAIEPIPWHGTQGWKQVSEEIKNQIVFL